MSTPSASRSLQLLLATATSVAVLATTGVRAQQTPSSFAEQYALADDRAAVVANLIPGTEDWYYYHCRERLDARDFATVRKVLPTWIKRHGRTARVIEIENREALLSYGEDPQRTFDFLRTRLGLDFSHQRVVPGARADVPTRLDPTLLSPSTLRERALRSHPHSVDGFHDRALAALASADLDDRQLHSLLRRLRRPDVPNLAALVVRDLRRRESRGFGSLTIHDLLRREQLDECVERMPELLQNDRFVRAYLTRLQPDADTNWFEDPEQRAAHLQSLWAFASRLGATFNSLKAHVLFHWLRHDLATGAPDKERFLNYIRLPRRKGHPARKHLERHPRRSEHVNLRQQYPTLMGAIGDDETLVRQCLEHFFQSEDSIDSYSDYLDANWLKRVLAETKILLGDGDMERWYSLLDDPSYLEQLERRVELRFPPTARTLFGADDPVSIEIETKNVPTLLVKVFAIDSYRYHVERQRPVDASIELDGVVANEERTYHYDDPPQRRVRRTFDLPMLREPGTYVVEFVGNGISSRAVVHKGGLRMVDRMSAAGHVVRVYDEAGRHVPGALAWFGGREYTADENGEILVPFSTDPGQKQLILRAGNRSSIASFQHRAESYALASHVHIDRESLVAGSTARMLVRPQLSLAGHPVSLKLLSDPVLTIVATDHDGLSTTQEVRDFDLVDGQEIVHELRVPSRLSSLQITLRGRLQNLDGKPVELATNTASFSFNEIDKTAETSVPLLLRTKSGYVVELRGKSGELQTGRVCQIVMHHRDYRDAIQATLQTDAEGRVHLGRLDGITSLAIHKEGGSAASFTLREAACTLPDVLHGTVGTVLRIPYLGNRTAPARDEVSLLGHNHDAFEHVALRDGLLELRGLQPGDYTLTLHDLGQSLTVRITRGQRDGRYYVGPDRALQASATLPLQIADIATTDKELRIRLANASEGTRVHVVATRYLPAYDIFTDLRGATPEAALARDFARPASSYHAGRKLSDEYRYVLERRYADKYPGNMLERPSLLLNPMALDEDSWNDMVGLGGGAGGRFGSKSGGRRGRDRHAVGSAHQAQLPNGGVRANLDYLPRGSNLLANLRADRDGIVHVPLDDLGAGQHVHVIAVDEDQAVYRTAVRDEQVLEPRPRTLPKALPSERHFVETRDIEFVAAGGKVELDDPNATKVEIHDSLASVYRLFATISQNPDLQEFAFVVEWPKLTREQKLEQYSRHACHELHFFLHQKDPEFFRSVVKPFLRNKLDKTFLDHWLLDSDLSPWLEPWKFAQLNLIEKILLAQRVGDGEREAVARMLRETLELNPISDVVLGQLFELALKSEQLHSSEDDFGRALRSQTATGEARDKAQLALEPNQSPMAKPSGGGQPANDLGPATAAPKAGRPAGPPPAERARRADEKKLADTVRRFKASADDEQPSREEAAEALEVQSGYAGLERLAEVAKRKNTRNLYREVGKTRLLVEHNYWHRRMENPTTNAVRANHFWVDYATAKSGEPFVSASLVEATGSFLEMMFALSVLDLPFEAGEHEIVDEGDKRSLRPATPLLLVKKQVAPAEPAADLEPLLLGENFYRLDDRYRWVDGQRRDAFVTDEFLVDVAYGCQVVVTNPTSSQRTTEVLLQVPEGAVPLQNGFWTRGVPVQLAPYATQTIEYSFYFPSAGEFAHYPVHAAEKGRLAAFAEPRQLRVVDTPSRVDTSSWPFVSQQGAPAEVLQFLDAHNLQRFDLEQIAWRMRDREFFRAVLGKLRQRHIYDATLWSYGMLHRDPAATREYLRHRDDFLNQCGAWLESELVSIDAKERRHYQHLELSPLVHQRAHQLGSERKFGNRDLARQYAALMNVLGYRPKLDSSDWLAVTYYFLLQDRIGDALASFARIDRSKIEAQVQYDYLAAYVCFFTGETAKARRIASSHRDHPATHWRKRFRDVLAQLDEAEGKAPAITDERAPEAMVATAPALELAIEGQQIAIRYENLSECEVRYYELDVEFAFSAQPFAGPDGASAAYVQPNHRETRSLPKGQPQVVFALPQQFAQKNVLVEVRAGGLVRSRQYFTNALDVRFLESYGQVAVREPGTNKPLAKTYVKVFARLPNGKVRFHKDGYTDLRGRFDYASLSDDPNRGATRYAVLVLDETRGAVIREITPPAR